MYELFTFSYINQILNQLREKKIIINVFFCLLFGIRCPIFKIIIAKFRKICLKIKLSRFEHGDVFAFIEVSMRYFLLLLTPPYAGPEDICGKYNVIISIHYVQIIARKRRFLSHSVIKYVRWSCVGCFPYDLSSLQMKKKENFIEKHICILTEYVLN